MKRRRAFLRAQQPSLKAVTASLEGDIGGLGVASIECMEICNAKARGEAVFVSARDQRNDIFVSGHWKGHRGMDEKADSNDLDHMEERHHDRELGYKIWSVNEQLMPTMVDIQVELRKARIYSLVIATL